MDESIILKTINNAYKNHGVTCPECLSGEITLISYGLPGWFSVEDDSTDPRILSLIESRHIVNGGCGVSKGAPKYFCRNCGNRFGEVDINYYHPKHNS